MHNGALRAPIAAEDLGTATVTPSGDFVAGSYATFTLTYTAGRFGIDDTGSLRIVFRFATDQTNLQLTDPEAPGYVTVRASNGAVLDVTFSPKANIRPWDRTLWIKVVRGYLSEGDNITVVMGNTEGGSPGLRLQTFCEDTFEFRVLADPIATFNFQPLPEQPTIRIVSGTPERVIAVIPTMRRVGETFALKVKGEDLWGNPSDRCDATLALRVHGPVSGAPARIAMTPGPRAFEIPGLSGGEPGEGFVELVDDGGTVVARTNPIQIVASETADIHFWADLHGQSEETVGTNSAHDYFAFARDLAFVDACAHQGNDFQMDEGFWSFLNNVTERFNEPHRYVTLPGYEWSGNTALGGDRNVFFPVEGRTIRRSSHALIEDLSDADTDCFTAADLFAAFDNAGEHDVLCFAHCGGRYADIKLAHDGRFEKSVEVHSSWGTFEWLVNDAFDMGYRAGIVANSDGHKGRPGASYPGAGLFGAIGGLTCYVMPELTRPALTEAIRRRRHYATTGGPTGRMIVDATLRFESEGTVFGDDPRLGAASGLPSTTAMMGDIVYLPQGGAELSFELSAASPVERVDVFNGRSCVSTFRPFDEAGLGRRIRVLWEGALYRGRARQIVWDGTATVDGNRILEARPIAFMNKDKTLDVNENTLSWRSITTGNQSGFDILLEEASEGHLRVSTKEIDLECAISDISLQGVEVSAPGELPRWIRASRLPDTNTALSFAATCRIDLKEHGDNPVFVRVALEDGTRAWTSPIYVTRETPPRTT